MGLAQLQVMHLKHCSREVAAPEVRGEMSSPGLQTGCCRERRAIGPFLILSLNSVLSGISQRPAMRRMASWRGFEMLLQHNKTFRGIQISIFFIGSWHFCGNFFFLLWAGKGNWSSFLHGGRKIFTAPTTHTGILLLPTFNSRLFICM